MIIEKEITHYGVSCSLCGQEIAPEYHSPEAALKWANDCGWVAIKNGAIYCLGCQE